MFNLLKNIGFPVRLVNFNLSGGLINGGVVVIHTESLSCQREYVTLLGLRLYPDIIVAGIVPTPDVQSGYVVGRLKRGEG